MKTNSKCVRTISALTLICILAGIAGCGKSTEAAVTAEETPETIVRNQVRSYESAKADAGAEERADAENSALEEAASPAVSEEPDEPYVSPVDFEYLHENNEDICAWLDIPGTEISYPILKSEEDGDFYLDHDYLKDDSNAGALFMDDYNSASFDDPVEVIYGHHMRTGAYFGNLQSIYEDEESFMEHRDIVLYLPDEERDYEVFAAVPYEKIHILYNYDFLDIMQFYVFFDRVYAVRSLSANLVEEDYPEFGQNVLILSTCLSGDNTKRYLVMAKEVGIDE